MTKRIYTIVDDAYNVDAYHTIPALFKGIACNTSNGIEGCFIDHLRSIPLTVATLKRAFKDRYGIVDVYENSEKDDYDWIVKIHRHDRPQ